MLTGPLVVGRGTVVGAVGPTTGPVGRGADVGVVAGLVDAALDCVFEALVLLAEHEASSGTAHAATIRSARRVEAVGLRNKIMVKR